MVVSHVWDIFRKLHRQRGSTGFGPAPLTDQAIINYQSARKTRLAKWEIEAILRVEDAYMVAVAEAAAKRTT